MSKTFKTQPFIVRKLNKQDHAVQFEEHHDHRQQACDLPPKDVKLLLSHAQNHVHTTCYYTYVFTGKGVCGCRMCTSYYERKAERRKNRHKIKTELREKIKET